mmetsp:Transcript_28862/g.54980  ORF Transcript_28862/g.54980 Transcript_28862/m.54980 type:complete len:224 (+) Transcript_28862:4767-5438(+)
MFGFLLDGLCHHLPGHPGQHRPRQRKGQIGSKDARFDQGPDRDSGGDRADTARNHEGHCRSVRHSLFQQIGDQGGRCIAIEVSWHAHQCAQYDRAQATAAKDVGDKVCGHIIHHQPLDHIGQRQPFQQEYPVLKPGLAKDFDPGWFRPELPDRLGRKGRFDAATAPYRGLFPQGIGKDGCARQHQRAKAAKQSQGDGGHGLGQRKLKADRAGCDGEHRRVHQG